MTSASSLPDPYTGAAGGQLSQRETSDLAACEAALDNLRVAFWAAGKALQVIRDARLYRETHSAGRRDLAAALEPPTPGESAPRWYLIVRPVQEYLEGARIGE